MTPNPSLQAKDPALYEIMRRQQSCIDLAAHFFPQIKPGDFPHVILYRAALLKEYVARGYPT